jgi:hypothetical protein
MAEQSSRRKLIPYQIGLFQLSDVAHCSVSRPLFITSSFPFHILFALPFGNHDSQIAITLGTGPLEIPGHGTIESPRRYQSLGIHDFMECPSVVLL